MKFMQNISHQTASRCVAVKTLPKNLLCEIEVIAAVEE